MRCLPFAFAALMAACAIAQPSLPDGSLWLRGGIAMTQPAKLRIPVGLRKADHVARVWPLAGGQFVWAEEERDTDGTLLHFRLRMADLTDAPTQDLLTGADPFEIGADWRTIGLAPVQRQEALDIHVRLGGSGLMSEVYRVTCIRPYTVTQAPEGTRVWDSHSTDGSIAAAATWALMSGLETLPDSQRRYATLCVAGLSNPQGRLLWELKGRRELPPWAEWLITAVAVAPDGRSIAYANPRGIWQVGLSGAEPKRLWPMPGNETVTNLLWAPDASGLYLTRQESNGEPYIAFLEPGTSHVTKVLEQAEGLCWVASS
jgi:hypothetical protein